MRVESSIAVDSNPSPKQTQYRDQQLKKACREFESVFTNEMLKSMRRTIEKCDLFHGGQGEEIYESLLDQELAKRMAGLGPRSLAAAIYRQFNKGGKEMIEEEANFQQWNDSATPAPMDPLKEGHLSSSFGWRKDPINGEDRYHYGIDIAAPEGTPVRAPAQGKVLMSGFREGYGNFVMLDHGQGMTTLYAHQRENKVNDGEWVKRGTVLGTVGSSGRSTGPHLHFEVRSKGAYQDPQAFLGRVSGEIETKS